MDILLQREMCCLLVLSLLTSTPCIIGMVGSILLTHLFEKIV
jgi:energy-converting hydrogenase Eha subunit C